MFENQLPPHSVEAEMCLLSSLMLAGDDRELRGEVIGIVGRSDFYQADHQIIFNLIAEMHRKDVPVDAMTVREALIKRKQLEEIGGIDYLAQVLRSAPNYANGKYYARTVREKAVLRRIITVASKAVADAYGFGPSSDEPSTLARRLADSASELASSGLADPVVTLGDAVVDVIDRRHSPEVRRIETGISTLDALIGGLAKSKFTIIGADPRVGKSQLIKQILRNIAGRNIPVGLVTVEEDREKVAENMLANQSGVANHRIAYSRLEPSEWDRLDVAAIPLAGLPFYIDDAQHRLDDIVSAIERLAGKYKCEVIAVDHLHLIDCDAQNREREVSKISAAIKATFKRCNVAGVAAAQLNRGQDAKQKPTPRNLRDSGSLVADADLIMLLFRPDAVRYQEENYLPTHTLEVNVAKNKDGRVGEVPLYFSGETQTVKAIEAYDPFAESEAA